MSRESYFSAAGFFSPLVVIIVHAHIFPPHAARVLNIIIFLFFSPSVVVRVSEIYARELYGHTAFTLLYVATLPQPS